MHNCIHMRHSGLSFFFLQNCLIISLTKRRKANNSIMHSNLGKTAWRYTEESPYLIQFQLARKIKKTKAFFQGMITWKRGGRRGSKARSRWRNRTYLGRHPNPAPARSFSPRRPRHRASLRLSAPARHWSSLQGVLHQPRPRMGPFRVFRFLPRKRRLEEWRVDGSGGGAWELGHGY